MKKKEISFEEYKELHENYFLNFDSNNLPKKTFSELTSKYKVIESDLNKVKMYNHCVCNLIQATTAILMRNLVKKNNP